MKGLGAAMAATIVIPIATGLDKAFKAWTEHSAQGAGRDFASKFFASMGGSGDAKKKFTDPIVTAYTQLNKDLSQATTKGTSPAVGAVKHGRGPNLAGDLFAHPKEQEQKIKQDYYDLAVATGKATVDGLHSVKAPSQYTLINDFELQLKKLPAQSKSQAAFMMLEYAHSLEKEGKLPKSAMKNILQDMEATVPGFTGFLKKQGIIGAHSFGAALNFREAKRPISRTPSGT